MRKIFFYFFVIIAVFLNCVEAQQFDVDYATFRGADGSVTVEVFLLIPRGIFKFVPSNDGFESNGVVRIAFTKNDTVAVWDQWNIKDFTKDTTKGIGSKKIPDIAYFQLSPGNYKLMTIIFDVTTNEKLKQEKYIELKPYSMSELDISDLELCTQMLKTEKKNKFSKYGYDMIPNASTIFGSKTPMVYSFCEVYNLFYNDSSSGSYNVRYSIVNLNGKEVRNLDWVTKKKAGNSSVEINGINIISLSSGLYDFKVEVVDNETGKTCNSVKRFYVFKEADGKIVMTLDETNYSDMSEEQLVKIFGPMKYVATEAEKRRFKKSDLEGKRNILRHFWDNRDPDLFIEFEERVRYADEHFSGAFTKGWASDMGRISIVYGIPSEIERFTSSIETKPYQVWYYYNVEGGIEFVFVDKSGFGQMELVHSTARNELQDYGWRRWIMPASSGSSFPY